MPITRDQVINNYIDFFAAGAKAPAALKYGLEAEHFVIDKTTRQAVPYFGENGVLALLKDLAPSFAAEYRADGHLLGLISDEAELSLEPGSQLELSVAAANDIAEVAATYGKYHQIITAILADRNQELLSIGYQPVTLVRDIELKTKKRYAFMDRHFRNTGSYGINMMRGTASCQVVLDYTDEQDFIVKYQSAAILTPLLALLAANAPYFEGQPNQNPLIRTQIWRGVDPARCGIPPAAFAADFSFRKYAEYIIGQDAIFEAENDVSEKSERKVGEILRDKPGWDEAYLLYLSLVFPDVRLRQYIEIRVADSLPADKMFAYMALIKGLFLDIAALKNWLAPFPRSIKAITQAGDAIMEKGNKAAVYGQPAADLLNRMLEMAHKNLNEAESEILKRGFG
jgi:glutamate--cysteine ligase